MTLEMLNRLQIKNVNINFLRKLETTMTYEPVSIVHGRAAGFVKVPGYANTAQLIT